MNDEISEDEAATFIKQVKLMEAYKVIVDHLRANTNDPMLLENFKGTEERCVRALLETTKSDAQIGKSLAAIVKVQFPVNHYSKNDGGLITQGPIMIHSCCPHHLYPVLYSAYVSYIPALGSVLGLSKLTRICRILGQRPVLQEQLASDIADVLFKGDQARFPAFASEGSGVMLVGSHGCMSCRGVKENALTSVVELRGEYWKGSLEDKFYQAVSSIKTTRL